MDCTVCWCSCTGLWNATRWSVRITAMRALKVMLSWHFVEQCITTNIHSCLLLALTDALRWPRNRIHDMTTDAVLATPCWGALVRVSWMQQLSKWVHFAAKQLPQPAVTACDFYTFQQCAIRLRLLSNQTCGLPAAQTSIIRITRYEESRFIRNPRDVDELKQLLIET